MKIYLNYMICNKRNNCTKNVKKQHIQARFNFIATVNVACNDMSNVRWRYTEVNNN